MAELTRAPDLESGALCDLPELEPQFLTRWENIIAAPHNVLLEGPLRVTETALALLQSHLRGPVLRTRPGERLVLDTERRGTLLMENVAALNAEEQTRLRYWLDESAPQARVVSTASSPLFSLVQRGLFDESLYYRLNVILLRIGGH